MPEGGIIRGRRGAEGKRWKKKQKESENTGKERIGTMRE